jgi:hypothetical protein
MPHYKSFFDREYLFAFDLKGRDVTLTIERVAAGELTALGGRKSKKPLCWFKEGREKKPLALNSTNCRTISALYGSDTDQWIGKRITLYPTTTQMAGETCECIRVRPSIPADKPATPAASDPAETESDA